jgi:uncharacterized NAD(P)/FAD-binding protein YdhS
MSFSPIPKSATVIAIVGGGYSGIMAAVNIMHEMHDSAVTVHLIDKSPRLGRGLAYNIWDDSMLLNVPVGNMSAFADHPTHFLEYCRELDPSLNIGSFVSRRIYGDYLEHLLAAESSKFSVVLNCVQAEAVAIHQTEGEERFQIKLADDSTIFADEVVLALGYLSPQPLVVAGMPKESPNLITNPWNFRAIDAIAPGGSVAIIGSGHTAIDALFRLTSLDNDRQVFMLSRRGLLPKSHRVISQAPVQTEFPAYLKNLPNTALAYMRAIRREVKLHEQAGHDWRDVLNELRPHTSQIWQRWTNVERSRFLVKIRPWWDVHRHRLAPTVAARLQTQIDSGRLKVLAGRITSIEQSADSLKISYYERASSSIKTLVVSSVINCTGPDYDLERINSRLLKQLRQDGLIIGDVLRLGLELDDQYNVIGRGKKTISGLRYLGPMLRARYWEAIAVPELRVHARQVALEIRKTMA